MRLRRSLTLLLLAAATATLPLAAQETVARMREIGSRAFSDGEFAEALPYFEQLIEVQGESRITQIVASLERIYYNAALCRFLLGEFGPAEQAFVRYNKKYPRGTWLHESYVYIGDAQRFAGQLDKAIKSYEAALRRFTYPVDLRTDIYAAIARCYLAQDEWGKAREPLLKAFECAPDMLRRNRAATLLATAYLKSLDLESLYAMVPYLLTRDSLASRSIAFNMAALESGDDLFAEERYREALWIYRLVYPYDEVLLRTEVYLEHLTQLVEQTQRHVTNPRQLMRLQEWVAETGMELTTLQEQVENYDETLMYRIARGYMEALRYREGCELFLQMHITGSREIQEEALYLAFTCAANLKSPLRAYEIGRRYMDSYPGGEWYDIVTLLMAQMYGRQLRWSDLILHLSEVLQVKPTHQAAAECLYLLGYAHFMEEQFEQALARLAELRQRFQESDLMDDAIYWSAMAAMFDGDFEAGATDFTLLLSNYPATLYATDAAYRRAVCNYALGEFELAEERLGDFAARHGDHDLIGEVQMTRGDIAGAVGRNDEAVRLYQVAMNMPTNRLNIEQFNHCAFQAGQILYDHERFAEVRSHFQRYLEMGRAESNPPLAIYWIGRAMWQMGERTGTIRFYREATLKHGKERLAVGVDMILDELVAATRRLSVDEARVAWKDIELTIRAARDSGDEVAALRFQRLLLYHPELQPAAREKLLDQICQLNNISNASPAILELMLSTAIEREQDPLAAAAAQAMIDDFTETDYALDARMYLARRALRRAAALPEDAGKERNELYETAATHLKIVRDVYATSGEAAEALLALGELHLQQRQFDEADSCFRDVLGVRGWRNLWPQALMGRGTCAEAKREWIKATAFYERLYVLYSGRRELVAEAYLRRAECLHRGFEDAKAIETLQELLRQEDLVAFPAYEQAQRVLARLGGTAP